MARYATSVLCFEPNPRLARLLRRSLPRHCIILEYALSDIAGVADLVVPRERGALIEGHAQLKPKRSDQERISYAVETRRLDDCVEGPVRLIKIDVEGHELRVLMGAPRTLNEHAPNIIVEAEERHRDDAVSSLNEFLARYDYRGFFIHDGRLCRIDEFVPSIHQRLDKLHAAGVRHREYVNNFVFTRDPLVIERLSRPFSTLARG